MFTKSNRRHGPEAVPETLIGAQKAE